MPATDVLLIYQQSLATDAELTAAGGTLAAPLADYLRRGGVVVAVDSLNGNSGTWQLLDAAGLLSVASAGDITGTRVDVLAPGDAVASGVPLTYVAERNSIRFDSTEVTQVVGDATGPVVIHEVFTP